MNIVLHVLYYLLVHPHHPKPWEPLQTSFAFNPTAATVDRFTIGFSRVRSSNDRFSGMVHHQYVFARKNIGSIHPGGSVTGGI